MLCSTGQERRFYSTHILCTVATRMPSCRVAVLNGGMPAWQSESLEIDREQLSSNSITEATERAMQDLKPSPRYQAVLQVTTAYEWLWTNQGSTSSAALPCKHAKNGVYLDLWCVYDCGRKGQYLPWDGGEEGVTKGLVPNQEYITRAYYSCTHNFCQFEDLKAAQFHDLQTIRRSARATKLHLLLKECPGLPRL